MPFVSIVMPVYRTEPYITASLHSICRQDFTDFEIILVDDGSPDNSIGIARAVLEKTGVEYKVISQENRGVSAARNRGIEAAVGEWVVCIDPDDEIHPRTLSFFYEAVLAHPEISVFGINFMPTTEHLGENMPEISVASSVIYDKDDIAKQFLMRQIKLIAPGLFIRKSLILSSGVQYRQDVRYSEDQLYTWYILETVDKVGFLKEKLYYYLSRPASTMTSSNIEKIMTGYKGFFELQQKVANKALSFGECDDFILSRWVFGVLRATAKYMSFQTFCQLSDMMNGRENAKRLRKFPHKVVAAMAYIYLCSRYTFYLVCKY